MNKCKVLLAAVLAVTLQFTIVAGTDYTVGAPGGLWDLSTDYTKWVSNITFYPGDNLLFNYTSAHDVWEVTESDYGSCTIGTPLSKHTSGKDVIALTETGSRYFYCSIGSHCNSGMKLAVTVVSQTDPNSPPSPPSPPSPNTDITPPPPPPEAPSTGAAAVSGVGFHLAIALVFGAMLVTFV